MEIKQNTVTVDSVVVCYTMLDVYDAALYYSLGYRKTTRMRKRKQIMNWCAQQHKNNAHKINYVFTTINNTIMLEMELKKGRNTEQKGREMHMLVKKE